MRIGRLFRHMLMPRKRVRRAFPKPALAAIAAAVAEAEKTHNGELRLVVEGAMPLTALWRDQTPRQRAVELFARLRIWDTDRNNGILIYVQMADRQVEILADRGISRKVGQAEWDGVCRALVRACADGDYRRGALEAVDAAARLLARHFPPLPGKANDLPDAPLVL